MSHLLTFWHPEDDEIFNTTFPHTQFCSQAQMQLRDERTWTLRDLLGLAGEPPTAFSDRTGGEGPDEEWYMQVQGPVHPQLVGGRREFNWVCSSCMPDWLPPTEAAALRRSIVFLTAGISPVLNWKPPITAAQQMKLTLPDLQQLPSSATRFVKMTLRAIPYFMGTPARDYVTVTVAGDVHDRTHYARCVCFFADADGHHFVALRWLAEVPGVVVDPVSRLVPLNVTPAATTASYSVMPVESIVNGALVVCDSPDLDQRNGTRMWALQSPREQEAYIGSNYDNTADFLTARARFNRARAT